VPESLLGFKMVEHTVPHEGLISAALCTSKTHKVKLPINTLNKTSQTNTNTNTNTNTQEQHLAVASTTRQQRQQQHQRQQRQQQVHITHIPIQPPPPSQPPQPQQKQQHQEQHLPLQHQQPAALPTIKPWMSGGWAERISTGSFALVSKRCKQTTLRRRTLRQRANTCQTDAHNDVILPK
jgi:type IV secretory pathway VirB10-like protein